jgi:hypothetical protein
MATVVEERGTFPAQPFVEQAIGCESCHGPGELHVRERGAGLAVSAGDDSIVNPAKLTPKLASDICMRCHQGNDTRVLQQGKRFPDFRPGTPLEETLAIYKLPLRRDQTPEQSDLLEHGFAMTLSKCFRVSGALTCTSCHSVHQPVEATKKVSYYRSKCMTCHTESSCRLEPGKRAEDDCLSCHMPKRPVSAVAHSALTNHRIVRTPNEPFPDAAYESEATARTGLLAVSGVNGRDPDDLVLLQAYLDLLEKAPWLRERFETVLQRLMTTRPEEMTVQAAAGHELVLRGSAQAVSRAVPLLQKAWSDSRADSGVALDLAEALVRSRRDSAAAAVLRAALAKDGYRPELHQALVRVLMRSGDVAAAKKAVTDYLQLFPADRRMRALGQELAMAEAGP